MYALWLKCGVSRDMIGPHRPEQAAALGDALASATKATDLIRAVYESPVGVGWWGSMP